MHSSWLRDSADGRTVETGDHQGIKEDSKASKDLGELEVIVRRISAIESSGPAGCDRSKLGNSGLEISEKALKGKALTHSVSSVASHLLLR